MRNGECRRETRHTRRFKKSTPTPSMYTAVIVLMVMSVSTATVNRNAASQELSAVYNDNGAHVGTDLDARPQGQSWMLNASFISSLIRKTGA